MFYNKRQLVRKSNQPFVRSDYLKCQIVVLQEVGNLVTKILQRATLCIHLVEQSISYNAYMYISTRWHIINYTWVELGRGISEWVGSSIHLIQNSPTFYLCESHHPYCRVNRLKDNTSNPNHLQPCGIDSDLSHTPRLSFCVEANICRTLTT